MAAELPVSSLIAFLLYLLLLGEPITALVNGVSQLPGGACRRRPGCGKCRCCPSSPSRSGASPRPPPGRRCRPRWPAATCGSATAPATTAPGSTAASSSSCPLADDRQRGRRGPARPPCSPCWSASTSPRAAPSRSTAGTSATWPCRSCAPPSATSTRRPRSSPGPSRTTCGWPPPGPPTTTWTRCSPSPAWTAWSTACPTSWTRRRATAASPSPAVSASASPSPAAAPAPPAAARRGHLLLDAVNELALRDLVEALALTTTVLVIAHRLSTVTSADRILVLRPAGSGPRVATRSCWPATSSTAGWLPPSCCPPKPEPAELAFQANLLGLIPKLRQTHHVRAFMSGFAIRAGLRVTTASAPSPGPRGAPISLRSLLAAAPPQWGERLAHVKRKLATTMVPTAALVLSTFATLSAARPAAAQTAYNDPDTPLDGLADRRRPHQLQRQRRGQVG